MANITANLKLDLIADDYFGVGGGGGWLVGVQKSTFKEFENCESRSVANIFKI